MTPHDLNVVLLAGSVVLILAVLAVRISAVVGLPSLLMYLGLGVLLGYDGAGVDFVNYDMALVIGLSALVLILAEGGLTTNWTNVKPTLGFGVLLATIGTAISVGIVAVGGAFADRRRRSVLGASGSAVEIAGLGSARNRVRSK